ncbi:SH3 domain-containing protein [Sphingomonas sp. OK281]|uniref:SH3 domain-containing protein n=1 Tax=Sphingomonas sp. OK281 TaxID=1881067 RepID=UPI0008F1C9B6|nr:SH3 domain-containing protein [Sphingomonas sp. OK281]SFO16058.1 SH3-like domain-containing protein [Sphingomonas sp. OK281]
MRILAAALSAFVVAALVPDPATAADATKKRVPYYASISASRARMRTGPARTYPASWLYQRQDLPIKVVAIFKEWRKVADPDGTEGWMQANLLSGTRTAIVHGSGPVELREKPNAGSRLLWRAAPGVVGRLSQCGNGWCRMDVKGQAGFVSVGGLWGVEAGEVLP